MCNPEPATATATAPATAPVRRHGQHGLSLVELMVALALGLLVVLSGAVVLSQARLTSSTVMDSSRLHARADAVFRQLGEHLTQAGAVELADTGAGRVVFSGAFTGYDPAVAGGTFVAVHGVEGSGTASDTLRISYEDDGVVRDCQGNRTAMPQGGAGGSRVDHEFTRSAAGELLCRGANGADTVAIGDRIEDFQVTYTLRTAVAGTPAFRQLTADLVPAGEWPAVSAVTVCLRLAGQLSNLPLADAIVGCRGESVAADGRIRRVVSRTFALRNALP